MNNTPFNYDMQITPLQKKVLSIAVLRVLVILFVIILYAATSMDLITNTQGFIIYTLLLLGYLVAEMKNLWERDPLLFWVNPVVIASLFVFILPFCITNLLYFMPEKLVVLVGLPSDVTPWMNQLMVLVVLAACALWIGYTSGTGRETGMMLQRSRLMHRLTPPSEQINRHAILACIFINLLARLWSIKLGMYGYSASTDLLIAGSYFSEYLNLADWLGKLVLLVVAIQYFSLSNPTFLGRQLLWFVLGYQVFFGFLSGMKSGVVIPFITVALACYCQQNRFPRWLIPVVVVAVLASYTVIEPFRYSRYENADFSSTSIDKIISTMTDIDSISKFESNKVAPIWLSVLARNNLTYIASLGIEYATKNKLPDDSPQFLSNILLAPAHALVPRFIWNDKPLQQDGLWYTQKVVGYDVFSATAMSPFTYLNFAGGPIAVIFGFLFVGIIQRGLFDGLRGYGTGGVIVLLGLLSSIGTIESSFNTFIIGIIRYFPMLVVAQYALLLHSSHSYDGGSNHLSK